MFELEEILKKRDQEINELKREVNGEYSKVGKHFNIFFTFLILQFLRFSGLRFTDEDSTLLF